MDKRETLFTTVNRIFGMVYYILGTAMIIYYASRSDFYHLSISLGTLAVPGLISLVHRLMRLIPSQQMNFLILAFTFLAYPLGGCLDFYRLLPGFDKIAHMLSGVFVSVLCIALYCYLKPGHRILTDDMALAMVFMFFGSMAVAGLWEVGEYIVSGIVKMDLQRVNATGIRDTMNDMLVCMLGTLVSLPIVVNIARRKTGLFASSVTAFIENNIQKKEP